VTTASVRRLCFEACRKCVVGTASSELSARIAHEDGLVAVQRALHACVCRLRRRLCLALVALCAPRCLDGVLQSTGSPVRREGMRHAERCAAVTASQPLTASLLTLDHRCQCNGMQRAWAAPCPS
jgi:hypothetical protein